MRRHWKGRALRFGLFALTAVVVSGFAVMALWNWLMPVVFGWRPISFGQALGLLLLSRVLFGGFRGGAGAHMHWRHRMRQRWEQMTPEERARFREGMRGCGHPRPTEGAPTA